MLIIGHRGAPSIKPENTIASFEAALSNNVDGLEFDVQITKDHQLVVFHDFEIMNSKKQKFLISNLSLSKIQNINNNYEIPTFEQVIQICPKDKLINIEIKSNKLLNKQIVFKIIQILKKYSLLNNIIISSFNPFVLYEIKKQSSTLKIGLLWSNSNKQPWFITHYSYAKLIPHSFHANINHINQKKADWVKLNGMKLFVYTINSSQQLKKAHQIGVDGIFSDYPNILEL